ncbi:MAG TPA: TIGR03086 family metal-binding protein [Actinoplanes sp.]|nr:TIGR03086 family metal-binding protein [Actinoplanes sp.]
MPPPGPPAGPPSSVTPTGTWTSGPPWWPGPSGRPGGGRATGCTTRTGTACSPAGWARTPAPSGSAARTTWSHPQALTGAVAGPWGRLPAPVALSGFVLELAAHAWDLAAGIGDRTPLDPDLATVALRIATRLVPPELRAGRTFGPPVAAPADADAGTRLAAYLGRRRPARSDDRSYRRGR